MKKNKNLKYGILFLLVIILLAFIGFYFNGITGNAIIANYSNTNYSAPYNLSNPDDFIFKISSDSLVAINDLVNLTANVSLKGGYIYQKGYVFNQRTKSWEVFNFDESPVENSYWIKDFASKDLIIDVSNNVHNSSETYIVAYACQKDSNEKWQCGCQSADETNCKRWMLHKLDITNITISPDNYPCTSNANCSMTNGTCDTERGVCVSNAVPFGTPKNPFKITSWATLDAVRNNLTANYILMNDLNSSTAGYASYASSTANGGAGWEPIGNGTTDFDFNGNFNGNGKTISDLYVNRPDELFIGLFGSMVEEGNISNLNIVDFNFTGSAYIGGLLGYNQQGFIGDCFSKGKISGLNSVGGLIGYSDGSIFNSHTEIIENISAQGYVGGLVGQSDGEILSSYSLISGSINANSGVGGLIGYNSGNVLESYVNVSGKIFGSGDNVGGFIGYHTGEILNSYAIILGNISANNRAGGLVGLMGATSCNSVPCNTKIFYSYANVSGSISATSAYAGGLVGHSFESSNNISSSYAIISGNISANYESGGVAGYNGGKISNSSATVSGKVSVGGKYAGGFVGQTAASGTISNSSATISGNISATSESAGGFVGFNSQTTTSNCFAIISGRISATSNYAGGFVGWNTVLGAITNSYAKSETTSYISSSQYAGGFVGYRNSGSISNCYAVRKGTGNGFGFTGGSSSTITRSYYDNSVFLQDAISSGVNSKSTNDMQLQSTYSLWDFINTWAIDTNKNNGYPYLKWQAL